MGRMLISPPPSAAQRQSNSAHISGKWLWRARYGTKVGDSWIAKKTVDITRSSQTMKSRQRNIRAREAAMMTIFYIPGGSLLKLRLSPWNHKYITKCYEVPYSYSEAVRQKRRICCSGLHFDRRCSGNGSPGSAGRTTAGQLSRSKSRSGPSARPVWLGSGWV